MNSDITVLQWSLSKWEEIRGTVLPEDLFNGNFVKTFARKLRSGYITPHTKYCNSVFNYSFQGKQSMVLFFQALNDLVLAGESRHFFRECIFGHF